MSKNNGLILFFLLQLPAGHVDVSVLVATQLLIEQVTQERNQALLQQLHVHLLFNFNIWSKGDFPLRIGGGKKRSRGACGKK